MSKPAKALIRTLTAIALEEALDSRNKIIHHVLIDNVENFARKASREKIINEIDNLRSKVRSCEKLLQPLLNAFNEAFDGVKAEEILEEIKKTLN